jgi:hypothetical protein
MADVDFVLMAEPLNPMLAMAQEAHKLLESYIKVGFTRKEAFDLVASQLPEWGFPGHTVIEEDGTVLVQKGSRFTEELKEINIGGGLEYWYSNIFAVRGGLFYENRAKGARQYFTFGAGLYYSVFGIDVSYLAALSRVNPLANTVRFSLKFKFGNGKIAD